ncbi:unnamed protein product, partial [Gongylonema pulchrum]|uniref:MAM domain-containing protein n=1 Tax=Gongylonema pulchrum TaxID=637853 RepID=A0A183D7A3_9BILA
MIVTFLPIVLLGDNFVGPNGGAIFVQDIVVDGELVSDCTVTATFDTMHLSKTILDRSFSRTSTFQDPIEKLADNHDLDPMQSNPSRRPSSAPNFSELSSPDSAFAACLKLSCNPAGINTICRKHECSWRDDTVRWMVSSGAAGSSNPLTGIMTTPAGIQTFLVASYNDDNRNATYQMISPLISIPASAQPIFFFWLRLVCTAAQCQLETNQSTLTICWELILEMLILKFVNPTKNPELNLHFG